MGWRERGSRRRTCENQRTTFAGPFSPSTSGIKLRTLGLAVSAFACGVAATNGPVFFFFLFFKEVKHYRHHEIKCWSGGSEVIFSVVRL